MAWEQGFKGVKFWLWLFFWDRAQFCSLAMGKERAVVLPFGVWLQELTITMSFFSPLKLVLCTEYLHSHRPAQHLNGGREKKISFFIVKLVVNTSQDSPFLLWTEALLPEFGLSLALNHHLFYLSASHSFFEMRRAHQRLFSSLITWRNLRQWENSW